MGLYFYRESRIGSSTRVVGHEFSLAMVTTSTQSAYLHAIWVRSGSYQTHTWVFEPNRSSIVLFVWALEISWLNRGSRVLVCWDLHKGSPCAIKPEFASPKRGYGLENASVILCLRATPIFIHKGQLHEQTTNYGQVGRSTLSSLVR